MSAPVAYRVKDFGDGWILCHTLEQAEREAKGCGNLIEPLVRQDGATAVTTFTLDTSGEVLAQRASSGGPFAFHWSDLDPFTQGYVEALFAAFIPTLWDEFGAHPNMVGFSDLSPEALAAILKDCGRWLGCSSDFGRRLWEQRQAGHWSKLPPLTPTLGEDGKVRLSSIERAEAGR